MFLLNIMILRKAEITVMSFFYILMGIFFIGILVFGFSKIFMIQNVLSDQELLDIKQSIKSDFEYCSDPLNSGNIKIIDIKTNKFDGIYLVGKSILSEKDNEIFSELKNIYQGGDNVVLFTVDKIIEDNDRTVMSGFNVIGSLKIDVDFDVVGMYLDGDPNSKIGDTKRDGTLKIKIACK